MDEYTLEKFVTFIKEKKKPPVFVIGAGFSIPSLPSAWDLKKEITKNLLIKSEQYNISSKIIEEINKDYFTLEVLGGVLKYISHDSFDPTQFWKSLNNASSPNKTTKSLAILKKLGYIGPIITTNFDSFIFDTCKDLGLNLNVITKFNHKEFKADVENSIIAVHGTCVSGENLCDPSTVVSRDFTKPFSEEIYKIVHSLLTDPDRDVVFAGYRGGDVYDMNIILSNLVNKDSVHINNHYWLSYSNPKDSFSQFVNDNFSENIYSSDIGKLLSKAVSSLTDQDLYSFSKKEFSVPWDVVVCNQLSSIDKEQSKTIISLIESGSVSAWVALEHYLLFSIGYDVEVATEMLGKKANYHELDLVDYIKSHEKYWEENDIFKSSGRDEILVENIFSETRARFFRCIDKAEESLDFNKDNFLDSAMLKVIIASSYDYLGLCDLQYAYYFEGEGDIDKSDSYRESSISNFKKCIDVCEEISSFSTDLIKDYIPHFMWKQIAEENIARAVVSEKRADALRYVIKKRSNLIVKEESNEVNNNYLLAHYPQLWLRICELVKSLLNCSTNASTPEIIQDNDLIQEILKEITSAEEAVNKFSKMTNIYNQRKAVLGDAKVCYLLSINQVEEAKNVLTAYMLEASEANNSTAIKILKNTKGRIDRFTTDSNKSN